MRPLLSLVMIVKDEAKSIENVLLAVKPVIDTWTIVDTGSSDDTMEIIRRVMADKPGDLISEPFVDFSTNRNAALAFDAELNKTDFQIMLSGDEYLRDSDGLRAELSTKSTVVPTVDCYALRLILDDMTMLTPRIFRSGSTWRYEGAIHEFPVNREQEGAIVGTITEAHIEHIVSDPEKRLETISDVHIPLLQKLIDENENDERALIFLAQSYQALLPFVSQTERLMYSLEAMGLLTRRLALKTGTQAERNWCKLQYLDLSRNTGVYTDREMFDRAVALLESSPDSPEAALLVVTSALSHNTAVKVYELADHAAKVAAARKDYAESTPHSTACEWRAHHFAAVAAKQLARVKPTEGPQEGQTWQQALEAHIAAGLHCGGTWETFQRLMELPPVREEAPPEASL